MDVFDVLLQAGLITGALVAYLLIFRSKNRNDAKKRDWNYPIKLLCTRLSVLRWKPQKSANPTTEEFPRPSQKEGLDGVTIKATSPDGTTVFLGIRKICGGNPLAEITVFVKLADNTIYKLPQHTKSVVGRWEDYERGWSAGGLKIQVLQPKTRLRILYNGLLTRASDNITQHVTFNFIWASSTSILRHPDDWSDELVAEALALDSWQDGNWLYKLNKSGEGSWLQYGTCQGRFESFTADGAPDKSEYLRVRGVRERFWLTGYQDIKRSAVINVATSDGTAVQLRVVVYRNLSTPCISGSVRLPDYTISPITWTDLIVSDFCERDDSIPATYSINVSTKGRNMKLILRVNSDGGSLVSGTHSRQHVVYRTLVVNIDGYSGTGLLELGYETSLPFEPPVLPEKRLRWLTIQEAGDVGYCAPFEAKQAACPDLVGGKGASLALLTSVQKEKGYRVPPGYCITTKALEKHLEANPQLVAAIKEIEAANSDYDENIFKEKCKNASELFVTTEITDEVKEEIISHLSDLRKKAEEQNLGPEIRFAVRSSAVGEDGEELSAAGQNDTVLGCTSDAHVLQAVRACWGSMFAFTSAYYRRQNGQACACGGGVVVQALVRPRAAGVMFTRHPAHGDPARLLITANYGLGESVVSGSVEPDTIIVSLRDKTPTIAKIELGTKKQRVETNGDGVTVVDVAESERDVACVSEKEMLRLASIGVAQDVMWGAGRDIEWAVTDSDIFLLQARPITSLERWTEEELLHELDFPIMADDEITTFANTGEVLPMPMSALGHDMMLGALQDGMSDWVIGNADHSDRSVVSTHNRCVLVSYNTMYRLMEKEVDLNVRMVEMAVHGRGVADTGVAATARHRRLPRRIDTIKRNCFMVKALWSASGATSDAVWLATRLSVPTGDTARELLAAITAARNTLTTIFSHHGCTSFASTVTQFIAMAVLLEGQQDAEFSPEQCHEISSLLSAGAVVSAEVPAALARLARAVAGDPRAADFRRQDPAHALRWLRKHMPHVHADVLLFLEQHGHRAIMEFDPATKPWALAPENLMVVLQNMRPQDEETKKEVSDAEVIAALKSPKKSATKYILSWVVPWCRRTVRQRETTKSHLILAIHKVRLALLQLGRQLVASWHLPQEDLVFHFRVHELIDYIATRDPMLLKKATLRRQYRARWAKLKFSEMQYGWPAPLTSRPQTHAADARLAATAVCGGDVVARACVITDLAQIGALQQGDILITHSTDIGWSPYFPLLSGIVTELGGLISHGAVIAREYGLPCVVGATGATDVFRTGDLVRLAGSAGLVERLQRADTDDVAE